MQELVGQCFSLEEGSYRIIDVRRIGGEAMVYAEEIAVREAGAEPRGPLKAAFHYGDIADFLPAAT